MKRFRWLTYTFLFVISFALSVLYFSQYFPSASAAAEHIVISEIQIGGVGTGNSEQEFVELYNPTLNTVDLSHWKLSKKTQGGTLSDLISTMSGVMKPHGYFLLADKNFSTIATTPDMTYIGNSIANDNTVLLFDNQQNLVDKVGMGNASDKETTVVVNPAAGKSIERKANSSSTIASMTTGTDEFAGNGEDTDNNVSDFILRTVPEPQNSQSAIEPQLPTPSASSQPSPTGSGGQAVPSATPTVSVTSTPTATLTPSATLTLTLEPTTTVIPTNSPTLIPTATLTPTLTESPVPTITLTPTLSPSPTTEPTVIPTVTPSTESNAGPSATPTFSVTLTPTVTPTTAQAPTGTITMSPTRTPKPDAHHLHIRHVVCTVKFHVIHFGRFHISIPFVYCSWILPKERF